jgi:hypothetical protein
MSSADRARQRRDQKRARQECFQCSRPAIAGVYCTSCARSRSHICRALMQRLRQLRATVSDQQTITASCSH